MNKMKLLRKIFQLHVYSQHQLYSQHQYYLYTFFLSFVHLKVLFNLANQYAANEMYAEALNTYQVIVKNKMFSNAGMIASALKINS